ncbi:MAG TPA: protein-glutamate O-methyltransferase [Thermodesulfovibrionales bacterium]|nr:protein-glutamate O-methyltransferase [Thermodesulfovibrionales bacterium]
MHAVDISSNDAASVTMSKADFSRMSEFIYSECGIKMSVSKKVMLESRLRKRLRALGLTSYGEYCSYLFSSAGMEHEIIHMIDMVTTNKTDFFREPAHFDYLTKHALPELLNSYESGLRKAVLIWSAGCSTGEEPYTLSMVVNDFSESISGYRYNILATDISTRVLNAAKSGTYLAERVEPVPAVMKRKYLLRSKDRSKGLVRVVPELRKRVEFRRLNFMDSDFGMRDPADIIFCRNVIIYFDRRTQESLISRFCRYLRPGGYLFMGHSETLFGMDVPLVQVAPTIYRKRR